MSSYYGVIFPEFWTGPTGRELRRFGKDAQLLGLYLATNRHANMIGLYRLVIDDVKHETGLNVKAIAKGFDAAGRTEFARFDAYSSYVWVRSMARFRLGLKAGEALSEDDNRAKATNRLYQAVDDNPFLGEFYDGNRRILRLVKRRSSVGLVVDLRDDHQMSGLPSPLEAPCKPVNRDQGSGSNESTKELLRAEERAPTREGFDHYQRLFLGRYHGKPTIAGAKDGSRMKLLLNEVGLPEVRCRLDAFFVSADPWIQQSGHTLDVFFASSTQTKLVAERGRSQPSGTQRRYLDWTPAQCPHPVTCLNAVKCVQRQDIDAEKARAAS